MRTSFNKSQERTVDRLHRSFPEAALLLWQLLCSVYYNFNLWGLRSFGRLWPYQYFGPLYPGVIAHHYAPWYTRPFGHLPAIFAKHVGVFENRDYARGIQDESIRDCAKKNGGVCTFWMGPISVIYINDFDVSMKMLNDAHLRIPLNETLSGVPTGDGMSNVINTKKRVDVLQHFMSPKSLFEKLSTFDLGRHMNGFVGTNVDIGHFVRTMIERIESEVMLNLRQVPLDQYMKDPTNRRIVYTYLDEIVDFTMSSKRVQRVAREYEEFTLQLLRDNFDSIAADQASTFQKIYRTSGVPGGFPKTVDGLGRDSDVERKCLKHCLGIVAGSCVNTSNALGWTIRNIESRPELKALVIKEASKESTDFGDFGSILGTFPLIHKVVLESIRYDPLVPTLGKLVWKAHDIEFRGRDIPMNPNTLVMVDILECNRTARQFPFPDEFNLQNVNETSLKKGMFSYMNDSQASRSFGGGHNTQASSKCPGRFFAITMQTLIIASIYKNYAVSSSGLTTNIENHHSRELHMVPEDAGNLRFSQR